jgi:ABC-type nitrate/sulfonate/bicarbonate transport system ATPase subunit
MRRRLAFIAAVAPLPRILLLDEPFASVDEPTRIQIHHDILRIIRRLDMTVIIVTHDLGEAASLSDRVVMLTSRPAGILSQHRIPFGRDRDVIALRQSPQFLDVYAALWHDLGLQLGSGRRVD